MKGILSILTLSIIFSVLLLACVFEDDIADITVENSSDYEVKNITLTYFYTDGKQTINIDILESGKSKTNSVVLQKKAVQTYTSTVDIVYYVNGEKFDIHNDENASLDVTNTPYNNNAFIGSGNNVKFVIKNGSYLVENTRK